MSQPMSEARLRRLQWAVRLTLALGVAASVTANVLHARPNLISQAIAAWPPVALLITVELVSRIPIYRRWLGVVRVVATFAIAGIAAWVSYHHMAAVVARYGETGTVPYLLPLSVDGLIVVASVSLVELAGRRRDTAPAPGQPDPQSAPALTPAASAGTPTEPNTALPAPPPPIVAPVEPAGLAPVIVGAPARTVPAEPEMVTGPVGGRVEDTHPDADVDPGTGPDEDDTDTDEAEDDADYNDADTDDAGRELDEGAELAADLVPLLPAARAARNELVDEGRPVSRDALARRMRRNGHSIRNNRVSELLAALRQEAPSVNGSRPKASV